MNIDMPKISPLAVNIKNKSALSKIWHWQRFVRKWELLEDWKYRLPQSELTIVIPKGFIFDGVTMPRYMHWFLSPTGIFFIPSIVHDFAYRYDYLWVIDDSGKLGKYEENAGRHFWDCTFKQIGLDVNNMICLNSFSRLILYLFGGISWKKNRKNGAKEIRPLI